MLMLLLGRPLKKRKRDGRRKTKLGREDFDIGVVVRCTVGIVRFDTRLHLCAAATRAILPPVATKPDSAAEFARRVAMSYKNGTMMKLLSLLLLLLFHLSCPVRVCLLLVGWLFCLLLLR